MYVTFLFFMYISFAGHLQPSVVCLREIKVLTEFSLTLWVLARLIYEIGQRDLTLSPTCLPPIHRWISPSLALFFRTLVATWISCFPPTRQYCYSRKNQADRGGNKNKASVNPASAV
ncbi:hypothetical protein GGS23DRAFT_548999 [Durotheca rogersii]|uniref:uncharacterized protein n=1 Tax=Durotheca rogersii TaxID=419775 RepID=UPI00221FF66C|nr:uncharacterized protein GGS23DRAFT_548999 [Durotheca rogersii]KAI5867581.1 hypothetical protein GGS23DRAFT_548999 [Durotheca rogersii]